jgi:glutamine cyclotransferase
VQPSMKLIFIVLIIALNSTLLVLSCDNNSVRNKGDKSPAKAVQSFVLTSPQNGKTIKAGEKVTVSFKAIKDSITVDSCTFNIDGRKIASFGESSFEIDTDELKMGVRRMSLNVYSGGATVETVPFALKVIPAVAPRQYGYRVAKEYPHSANAYTQGLFWHNGFMYEGTGQKGASSLRKTELATGKIVEIHELDSEYFGEGVCLHEGKIYQLTWQNRKGFIYNADSFALQGQFVYASEGWGITSDGKHLWMSDGTSNLYMLDAENMSVVEQIEVCTDKHKVEYLNELEYINGEIWANVYTEDYIVRINPKTGAVTGIVDLKGILKKELRKPETDVLNGIAYDAAEKRIYVTGKNWQKTFEITLVENRK